jgi:hypothetical protein
VIERRPERRRRAKMVVVEILDEIEDPTGRLDVDLPIL